MFLRGYSVAIVTFYVGNKDIRIQLKKCGSIDPQIISVSSHLKYGIRDVSRRKKDAYVNSLISLMKSTPCTFHKDQLSSVDALRMACCLLSKGLI